jgi:hypothetical protein
VLNEPHIEHAADAAVEACAGEDFGDAWKIGYEFCSCGADSASREIFIRVFAGAMIRAQDAGDESRVVRLVDGLCDHVLSYKLSREIRDELAELGVDPALLQQKYKFPYCQHATV